MLTFTLNATLWYIYAFAEGVVKLGSRYESNKYKQTFILLLGIIDFRINLISRNDLNTPKDTAHIKNGQKWAKTKQLYCFIKVKSKSKLCTKVGLVNAC